MNEKSTRLIRLYVEEDGQLIDMKHEFELPDLAGTVPAVGDFIVDPGVVQGQDRNNPANRTIYEVISRYFLPHAHGDGLAYVAVVVNSRKATWSEVDIACLS